MSVIVNTTAANDLIGRAHPLAMIRGLLVPGPGRVVTLWGPGGIGKTSLARAALLNVAFEETHWVALAGARSRADFLARTSEALAIEASARSDDEAMLLVKRTLSTRKSVLLVLDNVEQIAAEAATVLAAISAGAKGACFLVTSREVLGIPGEIPFELLPLALGGEKDAPSDAAKLLVLRARALRPAFDAEPEILERIASRLSGVPLALELAAARLGTMSAPELLARLDDRFAVLRRDHGRAEPRQRTLYDAIDWSWNLLSDAEKSAFSALSVFRGGFDAAAAEAIIGRGAADLLLALRHKSLLVITSDEPMRFDMLESIRELAAHKLGARRPDIVRAHARHYVHSTMIDESSAAREVENLIAISDHAAELHDDEMPDDEMNDHALAAITMAAPLLVGRGEASKVAEHAARACHFTREKPADPRLRSGALAAFANARFALGRLAEARALLEEAIGAAAQETSPARARMLNALGNVLQAQGHTADAMRAGADALACAEAAGARDVEGQCLASLAVIHHTGSDYETARTFYQRALAILRIEGPLHTEVRTRARLGFLMQDLGDDAGARHEYEEALGRIGAQTAPAMKGLLAGYLGNAKRAAHNFDGARESYARAIELLRAAGDRRFEAVFLMDRAIARIIEKNPAIAIPDLAAAAELMGEVGDQRLLSLVLVYETIARASSADASVAEGARTSLARAREAADSAEASAAELVTIAAAHVALANGSMTEAKSALQVLGDAPLGQHRRIANVLLRAALYRKEPPKGALVLAGSQLRLPNGEAIDLGTKVAALGVVTLLIEKRIGDPGAFVPWEDLIAAGWPGEKVLGAAGKNRLRVLVSALRSAGLGDVLESEKGGYRIAPKVLALRN